MNGSFYTAVLGAGSQQLKMDVISNNLANVNTNGYKAKSSVFTECLYYEMKGKTEADNTLLTGTGLKVEKVDTRFEQSGLKETGNTYDYAINGDGLFMLQDPATQEITYTRDGSFSLSLRGNAFYLVSGAGKSVLDTNGNPIIVNTANTNQLNIGIYDFVNKDAMLSVGDNEFSPVAKNGNPIQGEGLLKQGSLEQSNVDFSQEMAKVVEAQRAYSYALKMVQTSDEIEGTINSLRG